MNLEEMKKLLKEKEEYLEKVKTEAQLIVGQVLLLKEMIEKKENPKKNGETNP